MPTLDYASPPPRKTANSSPDRVGRLVAAIGFFQGLPVVIYCALRLLYPRDYRDLHYTPGGIAFLAWCAAGALLLIATGLRIRKKPSHVAINLAMITILPLIAALGILLWFLIADMVQFSGADFFEVIFSGLSIGAIVVVVIAEAALLRLRKADPSLADGYANVTQTFSSIPNLYFNPDQ
jgi:hypothetical protein